MRNGARPCAERLKPVSPSTCSTRRVGRPLCPVDGGESANAGGGVMWDYTRYPPDWDIIALRIKERDGWCCRWCGVEQGAMLPGRTRRVWLGVAHLGVPFPDGRP